MDFLDTMESDSVAGPEYVARRIRGAAIAVHRELGPGLLESTYEGCLAHELVARG